MKILSMSSGNKFPFVDYIPVLQGGATKESKTPSNSSKEKDILEEKIYDSLEYGLTSDFEVLAQHAEELLSDPISGDFTPSISKLTHIKRLANQIKISKDLYNNAKTHMNQENTGSEYALTSDGKIYAVQKDEGGKTLKISKIDISELDSKKEKYIPITNDDLLNIRNSGEFQGIAVKGMSFNDSVLYDVMNSVGMNDVVDRINTLVSKFGTNKITQLPNVSEAIAKGMKALYKIHTEYSGAIKDVKIDGETKKDISAAISYIYSGLNRNEKNALKLHAKIEGTSIGEYIQNIITSHTDSVYTEDFIKNPLYEDGDGKGKGKGKGSGSEKLDEQSWEHNVFVGGGLPGIYSMLINGRTLFHFKTRQYNAVKGADGKDFPSITTADEAYNNLRNRGLVAADKKVYLGNIPINISSVGKDVLIDSSAGLTTVWLPVKDDGNLDLSIMLHMSKVQKTIDDKRITDVARKKAFWEANGYDYNAEQDIGMHRNGNMRQFIVQKAYTSDNTDSFNDPWLPWEHSVLESESSKKFFEQMDGNELQRIIDNYDSSVDKKHQLDWSGDGWFDKAFRSLIFIPMNDNEIESLISGKQAHVPEVDANYLKAMQDAAKTVGNYNPNSGQYSRDRIRTNFN